MPLASLHAGGVRGYAACLLVLTASLCSRGSPPLPTGVGWVICVALGCFFAALVSAMVYVSNRNVNASEQTGNNSEVYSTAGRTISAGLTAADVVSKWTWAATLLQSSNVAWSYGVSGPFWYASGATIQVLLFAILAIEIKRKCPAIHTMLEIVLVRWGVAAHMTFLFFGLLTCLIEVRLITDSRRVLHPHGRPNDFACKEDS